MDKSSPLLLTQSLVGQSIPKIEIFLTKPQGGQQVIFAHYVMDNVLVSGYSVSSGGGDRPSESISFNYIKLETEFIPTNPDGSAGQPITFCWDNLTNKDCTVSPAPPGSFNDPSNGNAITPCPAGTFTNTAGNTACIPDPAGSYVGTTGATSSTPCAAGTFQPNAGQTSCILASPGFFVSTSGATQQTQCPFGTTSDVSGSTSCHPVSTPGKVTGGGEIGKDQNFGFEVRSSDGKTFKGHLEFHDKTAHIEIESHTITQLFVDSSLTRAIFAGQATTDSDHHDDDKNSAPALAFSITVTDPDKTGNHDTFSITVTDSTGKVTLHQSGTVKGHIEIHLTQVKHNDHETDKGKSEK